MARAKHRLKRKYNTDVLRAALAVSLAGFGVAAFITLESFPTSAAPAVEAALTMAPSETPTDTALPPIVFPLETVTPTTPPRTTKVTPKITITKATPPVAVKPTPRVAPAPTGGGGATAPFHPPNTSFAARFLAAANTFGHGIPYVYGGKSTSGADCSGFIWMALQKVAPGTPYRASGALKDWATPITQAQAVPGDLVFWPGHAAIYTGNGQVLSQGGPGVGPVVRALWPGYSFGRIPL